MQKEIIKKAPDLINFYGANKSFEEKIKEYSSTQARDLKKQLEEMGKLISLDSGEKEDQQKLVKLIERLDNGENWEDIVGSSNPPSDLTEKVLEEIFGFAVDKDLLDK